MILKKGAGLRSVVEALHRNGGLTAADIAKIVKSETPLLYPTIYSYLRRLEAEDAADYREGRYYLKDLEVLHDEIEQHIDRMAGRTQETPLGDAVDSTILLYELSLLEKKLASREVRTVE